jgi:two-component system, OmpR family, phosphate regulon sensor histidine kinase PhoR
VTTRHRSQDGTSPPAAPAACQAVIGQLPDVILVVTDLELRYVLATGGALARAGWRQEELLGHRAADLLPPPLAGTVEEHLTAALHGETSALPAIPGTRTGTMWEAWFAPLRDPEGAVTGALFLSRDITAQHRLTRQLRESEERYRVTLDSAAAGVANVALDGRFVRVNRRYCEITGYSEEELLGLTFQDITHPDDLDADLAQVRQLSAGQIPWYSMPKRYLRKDGSAVWVLLTGAVLRDDRGKTREYVATATDISAERRAQEEVARLNSELEERVQQRTAELEAALATVESQKAEAETMARFSSELAGLSSLESVCRASLRAAGDGVRADAGTVHVLDEQTGTIMLRAARGLAADQPPAALAPGEGLGGRALAEKRPVTASFPGTGMTVQGLAARHEARHELHVPLLHHGRAIGVIGLGRCTDTAFTAADLAALTRMAERVTLACAEALSLRQVQTLAQEQQDLMDSTDEGMYRMAPDGRITFVNEAALRMTGYQAGELLGQDAHEILHHHHPDGSSYPRADCPIISIADIGESVRLPSEVYWRQDGSPLPVEISTNPLATGGTLTGAVVTFHDITVRRMAERELAAQYRTSRSLAAAVSVPEALPAVLAALRAELGWDAALGWLPDPGSRVLTCAAAQHGADAGAPAPGPAGAGLPIGAGTAGAAWQRRETVFRPGRCDPGLLPAGLPGPSLPGDVAVPALDSGGDVLLVLELLGYQGDVPRSMLQTIEAATAQLGQYLERKRAEESAARAKDEFVATVSHDLRSPLTAINGWLDLLLAGKPGGLSSEQRDCVTTIRRNSDRLMSMINDLLVLGEADAGSTAGDFSRLDVSGPAREAAELLRPVAAQQGVELTVQTEPAVIEGEDSRIGQLISNLLSNAVKFTPGGGHVTIRVSRSGGDCLVQVTDTGIGIPAADREHLFERFYRGSNAREREIPGTGLGLAICEVIAEAHHGTIEVASTAGNGTRFLVRLPLAPAA